MEFFNNIIFIKQTGFPSFIHQNLKKSTMDYFKQDKSDYNKKNYQRRKIMEDQHKQINQGLPNIGNICFLNSAIQFLYSSTKFRMILQTKEFEHQSLENNLKKIFRCIQEGKTTQQKAQILMKITQQLQKMDFNYKFNTQQDCFQLVLMIINLLGQRYQEFLQLFKLYNKYVCKKCSRSQKRVEYMVSNQIIYCQNCYNRIEICYISEPFYIIFYGLNKTQKNFQITTARQLKLTYKLKAKVLYSGDGYFGHYKSVRLKNVEDHQGDFYVFNDSMVYPERSAISYTQRSILSLYELKIQNQQSNKNRIKTQCTQNLYKFQNNDKQIDLMNRTINVSGKYRQNFPIIQQKKKSQTMNKIIQQFFSQKDYQIFGQMLRAIVNVQSLKKKIQLISNQEPVVKIMQIYLKNLHFKKTPTSDQHCLQSITQYLINHQSQKFQKQLDTYYQLHTAQNKQKKKNISQLKILLFISIIKFICMHSPQIAESFKCQYKNNSKQHFVNKIFNQFFIMRQSYIYCNKQFLYEYYFSFLRKPQYIIAIQRKVQKNQKFICKQNQKQVTYRERSCIKICQSREPIFIRILEIYKLKVQLCMTKEHINKNIQIDENITIRKLLQRKFYLDLQKYKNHRYNHYYLVTINQNPINQNQLNNKLQIYQYLWNNSGNRKQSHQIFSYLKLRIKEIN